MRHTILSTTLLLVLGGGLALADDVQMKSPPQPTQMDVFFDTDSSQPKDASNADLQALADWAKCKKTHIIKLEGHADKRGSVEYNAKLAEARAKAVSDKLIELGAPRDRIVVTVYGKVGEQRDTLAENRRVDAVAEKQEITASR
jgi:outer membrane protein OmpA-like peptidoglycan-associated protein